jgi:DNA-directed RNA polymerase subunit H (RpoH/RPB5)
MESKIISLIINGRRNILELMEQNGYDTSAYNSFTRSEVIALNQYKQLDMILPKKDSDSKIYIRFSLDTKVTSSNITSLAEALFEPREDQPLPVLTKNDILYIVFMTDPNETVTNVLKYLWETQNIYIIPQSLPRVQFNIMKHSLVPMHRIMSETEVEELKKTRNIKLEEFPKISRFDPVAQAICMKPGQVCEITRPSKTSVVSLYYRHCVNADFAM